MKILLKLTQKQFKKLQIYSNDEPLYSKNAQSEILNLGGKFAFLHSAFFVSHSFLPHSYIASS